MDWILTTNSSNIEKFRYNVEYQVLEVEFKSGAMYQYFDVPPGIYQEFVSVVRSGGSAGKYLNSSIKGYYRYARA